MLWLIPHLFADPRLLDAALPGLRLPALAALLARGTSTRETAPGTEAALARACGVRQQRDWPLAALTRLADNGTPDDACWLRADPAHFTVMRDRVVLSTADLSDLSAAEAHALTAALAAHFGDDFAPHALHPRRWYLRFAQPPRLLTTPPSLARGYALDRILPGGDDAAVWRARLNEAQMLLHSHPVNSAREASGRWPVNGLWLWGGGVQGPVAHSGLPAYASGDLADLARACGCHTQNLPAKLDPHCLGKPGIWLLDSLETAALHHDTLGWRHALQALEADWFAPLVSAWGQLGPAGLVILDPISGRGLAVQRSDRWKIWRRPVHPATGLG